MNNGPSNKHDNAMPSCKKTKGSFYAKKHGCCSVTLAYDGTIKSRERPPPYPGLCSLEDLLQPVQVQVHLGRRQIRLIECTAKCRYLKKLTSKETLRQVFYLSEAPSPHVTPYSPPPYTLYTCIQYTYSHRVGRVRGGGNQRIG